jgi:hypothetical protein
LRKLLIFQKYGESGGDVGGSSGIGGVEWERVVVKGAGEKHFISGKVENNRRLPHCFKSFRHRGLPRRCNRSYQFVLLNNDYPMQKCSVWQIVL